MEREGRYLLTSLSWLDRIFGALFVIVIYLNFRHISHFGIVSFSYFNFDMVPDPLIIAVAFTVCHLFVFWHVVRAARLCWGKSADFRCEISGHIVDGSVFILSGMSPTEIQIDPIDSRGVSYRVRLGFPSPAALLLILISALSIISFLRFESISEDIFWFYVGMIFVILNWQIGSNWLFIVAEMLVSPRETRYFSGSMSGLKIIIQASDINIFSSNKSLCKATMGFIFMVVMFSLIWFPFFIVYGIIIFLA